MKTTRYATQSLPGVSSVGSGWNFDLDCEARQLTVTHFTSAGTGPTVVIPTLYEQHHSLTPCVLFWYGSKATVQIKG